MWDYFAAVTDLYTQQGSEHKTINNENKLAYMYFCTGGLPSHKFDRTNDGSDCEDKKW